MTEGTFIEAGMKIWKYVPDSDHFQTLALFDHERDGPLFDDEAFKLGTPLPEPLPRISVVYEKEVKDLSPSQRRLARQGQLPQGDFPSLYGTEVIFTEGALQVLLPLIRNSAQVIPLQCGEDMLYLIHVTNVVDCLDRSRSTIKWLSGFENEIVFQVQHFVFHEGKLRQETIFRIPDLSTFVFVSDSLRATIVEHGLKGLVWKPLP